jgi:hypothetical protein
LPVEFEDVALQRRLLPGKLRFLGGERGLGVRKGVELDRRVDDAEELALVNHVAELDLQGLDLPSRLGADIDHLRRLQRARGEHGLLHVALFDDGGQIALGRLAVTAF